MKNLTLPRVRRLLGAASRARVLVVGDLMLDQFIWGRVTRISPEAPVPILEFQRESFMPGGAANVARNLAGFTERTALFGVTGRDAAAGQLRDLLRAERVECSGILGVGSRMTTRKVRLVAQQQQVARVDRESPGELPVADRGRLMKLLRRALSGADAVIVGDYGKGVVCQAVLDELREACRERGIWLSLDPKPVHNLDLAGLSLVTPNRKEAFELAGLRDPGKADDPLRDKALGAVVERLMGTLRPALLLVTLGEQGMLLCAREGQPRVIPTVAQEVFDVSGAGDTVIATMTLAVAAGASPLEAAVFANHAAGVVVGKVGTAVVTREELLASFKSHG
jgi:D-beta-D-heptose 7-phosphate kinase/D-beta-D-heptose 1-phosphate adenosyltransferase